MQCKFYVTVQGQTTAYGNNPNKIKSVKALSLSQNMPGTVPVRAVCVQVMLDVDPSLFEPLQVAGAITEDMVEMRNDLVKIVKDLEDGN